MFHSHVRYCRRCPDCRSATYMSPSVVTVTPSYVGWDCPNDGRVWVVEKDVNVRLWLVESGAVWLMDDPLTDGDVTAFALDLEFHDDLAAVLEAETR